MKQTLQLLLGLAALCLGHEDMHIIRIDHVDRDLHPDLMERFNDCEILGHEPLSNTEVGCRSLRHIRSVQEVLADQGHRYTVTNEEARVRAELVRAEQHDGGAFNHSRYHSADDIEAFLWHLADKYPMFVRLTVDPELKSRQGRNLTILTIETPTRIAKNSVWVDAGLHAREWISPAATLYFIEKLVNEFDQNLHNSVYTRVSWNIMPLANPDGYENSRQSSSKRWWRKNMSPPLHTHPMCAGTDLNRNVGFPKEAYGVGASSDPCSDIYKGNKPDSEPETQVIINAVRRLYDAGTDDGKGLKSSIAIHSYGQKWLTSWGYKFEVPDDHDRLTRWGKRGVEAIEKVRGTKYKVGTASGGLYIAGGATDDYAKALGVPFVATIELGDTGKYGFVLPAQEIKPTGEELYEAMGVVAETAANPDHYS